MLPSLLQLPLFLFPSMTLLLGFNLELLELQLKDLLLDLELNMLPALLLDIEMMK